MNIIKIIMAFTSNKKRNWKVLRNSLILGGIAGVSNCISIGTLTINSLYSGILTALLVLLIELKYAYKIKPFAKRNNKTPNTFFLC